jgi:aminoglycoside 3'-phosphotransferase-2
MNAAIDSAQKDDHLQSYDALHLLPCDWRAMLAGHAVEPAAGMGGAFVFRVSEPSGCRYLKLAAGQQAAALRQEIARTEWLSSQHVRVPELLMKACTDEVTAVLMTALPGRHLSPGDIPPGHRARVDGDLPALVRAIGRGLARLHALPAADCPFDEMPRTRLARAREAIDRNQVDASQFDDRNAGVTPEMLYQRLAGAVPAPEDVVVVHGDATLANMLIGPDGQLGFIDCANAGRSDRYLDLAVAEMDLHAGFGPEAASGLIAAYGIHWDERKAAFFRDLYELF